MNAPQQAFDFQYFLMTLTPGRYTDLRADDRDQSDYFAYRIEEQIDVGRIVRIGFNNKGVTAAPQFLIFLCRNHGVAGFDHNLIDFIEYRRG